MPFRTSVASFFFFPSSVSTTVQASFLASSPSTTTIAATYSQKQQQSETQTDAKFLESFFSRQQQQQRKQNNRFFINFQNNNILWEQNNFSNPCFFSFSSSQLFASKRWQSAAGATASEQFNGTNSSGEGTGPSKPRPVPTADFQTTCPFQCLGLTRAATKEEVRENFLQLAKVHHPDVGGDAAKFKRVRAAYKQSIEMIETGYAAKTAQKSNSQSYQAPHERERNGEKRDGCANEDEHFKSENRRKRATYYSASQAAHDQKQQEGKRKSKNPYSDSKRTANFSSANTYANAERQAGGAGNRTTGDGNSTYSYTTGGGQGDYYDSFMSQTAGAKYEERPYHTSNNRDEKAKSHNTSGDWFKEMYEATNARWNATPNNNNNNSNNNAANAGTGTTSSSSGNTSNSNSNGASAEMNGSYTNNSTEANQNLSGFGLRNRRKSYSSAATSYQGSDRREAMGHPGSNGGHHDPRKFYTASGYSNNNNSNDQYQASQSDWGNKQNYNCDEHDSRYNHKKQQHQDGPLGRKNENNTKKHHQQRASFHQQNYNSFDGSNNKNANNNGTNNNNNSDGENGNSRNSNSNQQKSYENEYRRYNEETAKEFGSDEGWFEFRDNFFRQNRSMTTRDLYRFRFSQATSVEEIDQIYSQAMDENIFSGYDIGEPLFLALERYHLGLGLGDKHLQKCFETIDDWESRTQRTAVALYYHVILKLYTNDRIMSLFPDLDSSVATEVVWKVLQRMQDREVQDDEGCVGRSWWELLRLACMHKGDGW